MIQFFIFRNKSIAFSGCQSVKCVHCVHRLLHAGSKRILVHVFHDFRNGVFFGTVCEVVCKDGFKKSFHLCDFFFIQQIIFYICILRQLTGCIILAAHRTVCVKLILCAKGGTGAFFLCGIRWDGSFFPRLCGFIRFYRIFLRLRGIIRLYRIFLRLRDFPRLYRFFFRLRGIPQFYRFFFRLRGIPRFYRFFLRLFGILRF